MDQNVSKRWGSWAKRLRLVVCVIALVVAPWGGCITSVDRILMRYNAKDDRFQVLNLYEGIGATEPYETEYLYQRWRNRDHLIAMPYPSWMAMGFRTAAVRLDAHHYTVALLESPLRPMKPQNSAVPLDAINVRPGRYFISRDAGLCYYDVVDVPGTAVDTLLAVLLERLRPQVLEAIACERNGRRAMQDRVTWDGLRKYFAERIGGVTEQHRSATGPADASVYAEDVKRVARNPLELLDDNSLVRLESGLRNGTVSVGRTGGTLHIDIPLSKPDVRQFLRLHQMLRDNAGAADRAMSHEAVGRIYVDLLEMAGARHGASGQLRMTLNIPAAYNRVDEMLAQAIAQQSKENIKSARTSVATPLRNRAAMPLTIWAPRPAYLGLHFDTAGYR